MFKATSIMAILFLSGCSAKGVLTSEQTTKAIVALSANYNDLARKHNALVDKVAALEPKQKVIK